MRKEKMDLERLTKQKRRVEEGFVSKNNLGEGKLMLLGGMVCYVCQASLAGAIKSYIGRHYRF